MKHRWLCIALILCLAASLLPFGVSAVDTPSSAALLKLDKTVSSGNGWYRFVPDADAIYCITSANTNCTMSFYQSRLAPSEISYEEQYAESVREMIVRGRQEVADGQALFDDASRDHENSRAAYNELVKLLNENRTQYEYYSALDPDSPLLTDSIQSFLWQYEDIALQAKQYEEQEKNLEVAKGQLDEAYDQLAKTEAQYSDLKALIAASKAGRSGPLCEATIISEQQATGLFYRGSEFYIHVEPTSALKLEKLCDAFADVPEDQYYFEPVYWAAVNDITDGTDETHFSPNDVCTRAQAVTFLWRYAGCPKTASRCPFGDVSPDAYYYDAVRWAVLLGITDGTDETHFSPDEPCSRAQIVTFLWRAFSGEKLSVPYTFTDVPRDAYFGDAVAWAVAYGVTDGTSNTTFSPNDPCTRAQIVAFLYRVS